MLQAALVNIADNFSVRGRYDATDWFVWILRVKMRHKPNFKFLLASAKLFKPICPFGGGISIQRN